MRKPKINECGINRLLFPVVKQMVRLHKFQSKQETLQSSEEVHTYYIYNIHISGLLKKFFRCKKNTNNNILNSVYSLVTCKLTYISWKIKQSGRKPKKNFNQRQKVDERLLYEGLLQTKQTYSHYEYSCVSRSRNFDCDSYSL